MASWGRGRGSAEEPTNPMDNPLPRRAAANPTQYNIDAIASLERDALGRRTPTERISDVITKLVGNVGFLLAQALLILRMEPDQPSRNPRTQSI